MDILGIKNGAIMSFISRNHSIHDLSHFVDGCVLSKNLFDSF